MAAYKAEFLAQHYKGRRHPLQHYVFGFADKLARFGSLAPGLTNAVLTGWVTGSLIKRVAAIAQERKLPALAEQSFQTIRAVKSAIGSGRPAQSSEPAVVLWPDTWNNYY